MEGFGRVMLRIGVLIVILAILNGLSWAFDWGWFFY
jgi:hypothetical protein